MIPDFSAIDSDIDKTALIYSGARIRGTILNKGVSVGNFSRVDYSKLGEKVRVDRNNHIYQSSLSRFSYTGMNTVIMHSSIGAFTSISWNVSIGGADHDYSRMTQHSFLYNAVDSIRPDLETIAYDRFNKPVTIGCDVWIAAGAVITRGVTIGHGAVIGANAVVTKNVPPYAIAVGSPAKVIKHRFSSDIVSLLLQLRWWDWSDDKLKKYYDVVSQAPDIKTLKLLLAKD
ncbi:chloramphenicol acetyltransferase [Pseudoalteromonas arctica]|uniref:Chloramphenicol acetyltransferase n=1 Tax=Pseudoalteromonas arctica TaxID=394751 RepID=A0A7X9U5Y6_9GAMM|nr:CatB-related O-acetyltransferase [Pseudoalteromonas arctica]NMF48123.1 chloramphenicol acetyltransferase [Pseudoalteromonas arctica]